LPRFIDHHTQLPMPSGEGLEALRARVNAPPDANGVKGVNILFAEDGSGYCLFDAPNADAVVNAHRASGVPIEEATVHQVTSLI
jgi:(2Fe-2S) ferredoxin